MQQNQSGHIMTRIIILNRSFALHSKLKVILPMTYIWQQKTWPSFSWNTSRILNPLSEARKKQGYLLGKADFLDLESEAEVFAIETPNFYSLEYLSCLINCSPCNWALFLARFVQGNHIGPIWLVLIQIRIEAFCSSSSLCSFNFYWNNIGARA